jgi:hypothetical protein
MGQFHITSWEKDTVVFDLFKALGEWQADFYFNPLAGMPHKGEIEYVRSNVFQAREIGVK